MVGKEWGSVGGRLVGDLSAAHQEECGAGEGDSISPLESPLANLVSIAPALVPLSLFLLVGKVWKEAEYMMSLSPAKSRAVSWRRDDIEVPISAPSSTAQRIHLPASTSRVWI